MIFLTCYTKTYERLAFRFGESCQRFDLRHRIVEITSGGDWRETELHKPQWIAAQLLNSREPVCWADADCVVARLPSLLLGTAADFAIYNWHADSEGDGLCHYVHDPTRLLCSGGVIMFGYTAPALELLMRWDQAAREEYRDAPSSDQVLDAVYNRHAPPVRPLWLPKAYNRMRSHWPGVAPVIDHDYQAGAHSGRQYAKT